MKILLAKSDFIKRRFGCNCKVFKSFLTSFNKVNFNPKNLYVLLFICHLELKRFGNKKSLKRVKFLFSLLARPSIYEPAINHLMWQFKMISYFFRLQITWKFIGCKRIFQKLDLLWCFNFSGLCCN